MTVASFTRCGSVLVLGTVTACSAFQIDKQAGHMATLQFTGTHGDAALPSLAILRAAGDEVAVIALTPDPDLSGLKTLLAERGLGTVRALVFTITPRVLPRFPDGVAVGALYAPRSPKELPGVIPVTGPRRIALTGLELELSPLGAATDALIVEVHQSDNRMLLVPDVGGAATEIGKRAKNGRVDLLGVISPETLDLLRGVDGLEKAQVVVAETTRGDRSFDTISLAEARRILFQCEEGRRPVRIETADAAP